MKRTKTSSTGEWQGFERSRVRNESWSENRQGQWRRSATRSPARSWIVSLPRWPSPGWPRSLAMLALTAFAFGPGCISPPSDLPGIVPDKEQEDIPVPKTMDLVESEDYVPEGLDPTDYGRSWRATYHGRGELTLNSGGGVGSLAAWFVKNMREHGWIYRGMRQQPGGKQTLRFEKGDEEATLELSRKIDFEYASYKDVVKASIHPRGIESYPIDEIRRSPTATTPAREQDETRRTDTGDIEPAQYEP